ncbi:unnamed protein product, partial [Durusdinium trenchii]
MGLEDADKAAAAELVKQAAQAIFLFPDNLESGSPEENNAYGKLSDFFWFTKSEFSENVQQLQQKVLASALSHIFTTSPKDDYQCEAHDYAALLLCFLPQQDVMAKAVLDEHVGKYLVILGNLAGKVKSITGYKKFALFLQAELSRSQQDQAATQRAKTLQTDVSEVNAILTGRTQVGPFTLMRLVDMVKTLQKLVEGIAALPMGESSQRKEIREFIVDRFTQTVGSFLRTWDVIGAELVDDVMAFADAFGKTEKMLELCAPLKLTTKDVLKNVGYLCEAFAFQHHSEQFMQALSTQDVSIWTDNGQPDTPQAERALRFQHLCCDYLPNFKLCAAWSAFTKEAQDGFDNLFGQLRKLSKDVMWKLHNMVVDFYGTSNDKPKDGWMASDPGLEKAHADMKSALMKLQALCPAGEAPSSVMKVLETSIKEIDSILDVQLTAEEKNMKAEICAEIKSMRSLLPALTLEELMNDQSVEFFQSQMANASSVSGRAGPFFERIDASKPLDRFGQELCGEVNQLSSFLKVFLASLSACGILKQADPAKAASFEETRLKPRDLSMDQIPKCIRSKIE